MTEKNDIAMYSVIGLYTILIGLIGTLVGGTHSNPINRTNPKNTHLKYVNKDNLLDLVYKTGEIYLQTKEGNFVSYNKILEQEKYKLDSIYQVKKDSLKKVFENKLEKVLLE